jgi:hypothetical protein
LIYGAGTPGSKDSVFVQKRTMDRKREILAKLAQIQEQAQLTLDELPLRLAKDRLRLIIGLARYLSTAVEVNWEEAGATLHGREDKPPLGASRS